jgi:long-chain fatty acid transport protein
MDIMMAAPAGDMVSPDGYFTGGSGDIADNATTFRGFYNTSPALVEGFVGRVDFSDDNDFTGQSFGYGLAGKLGFTFKANDKLTIGGAYHTKTDISDMETSNTGAHLAFYQGDQVFGTYEWTGKITIKDFQWPATTAIGAAYQATPKLMLVGDVKHIAWSDVMKDFNMTFTGAGATDGTVDFTIPQNWKDQTVIQVGGQYQVNDKLAVRAGYNYGKNPVPDDKLQPLFPATPEKHYTLGAGYKLDNKNSFGASVAYAPEVENTSTVSPETGSVEVTHSQLNITLNYVRKL